MKKKKPDEQTRANFKNNPFKPLKGFTPHSPAPPKTLTPPRAKAEQAEDEGELFLRAVSGARRIASDEHPAPGPLRQGPQDRPDAAAMEDRELFLKALRQIGPKLSGPQPQPEEEELDERERRIPGSRMRQLKRGTIQIKDELDLHGFLREEALQRLGRFIAGASSRGQDAVLVITGKGVNSAEGPVLRGAAAEWLRGPGKGMVAEFAPAPRDKGGSGAFVVFLKKKD